MASNLRRSKRTVGKRVNELSRRVSRLQKRPAPKRLGRRAVSSSNLDQDVVIDINAGANVAVDFYADNNQNSTVPTTPTVNNDGTAITHVINTDSTATITFNWNYTVTDTEDDANNIDGFVVHIYQSTSSSSYNFTSSNLETTYFTARDKRSFVLVGVPADKYFTFGVKAYRSVASNISTTGVLYSAIAKSIYTGEDPFQPSSSISYTGTIDGVAASTVSTVATNFNSNNDQNATAITAPTISSDGTSIDHTINTDGSVDISFEWNYTTSTTQGAANNIDGFAVYVHTNPQYAITNISATGSVVTYTTAVAHGYSAGETVVVNGVTPAGYNGTFTVLASPAPTSNAFSVTNSTTGAATLTTAQVFGSTSYVFGSSPASTVPVYYVDATRRAFILSGVAANLYYTFGVRAYRVVNSNIDVDGILYNTTVVQSSRPEENPYRPSSTVAFTGSIGGTLLTSTPASNVYNATENFNSNNDQFTSTPSTPTSVTLTTGPQSTNATVDLRTTWAFTTSTIDDGGNIDGFAVYLRTIQPVLIDSLSASGSVVTYTTKTAHGFAAGNSVVVSGISPVGYTGTFTVLASPAPTTNTFAVSNATTGTATFTTAQVYNVTLSSTDISTLDLDTGIQQVNLTAEKRSHTFSGVSPNSVYKVAVRAYRVVDKNVNADGILFGALANSATVTPTTASLGGDNSIYIGNGKMYIGAGNYGNTNTGFYVDNGGSFSLKDKLTFNGTTLAINGGGTFTGALSAASGTFQGRLQAGDIYIPSVGSPVFSVTSAGALTATSASITGAVTATSGSIGNYTISGGALTASGSGTPGLFTSWTSTISLNTDTSISTSTYYSDTFNDLGFHNVITFNNVNNSSGGIKVERGTYNAAFTVFTGYAGYDYGPLGPQNLSDERLKDILDIDLDCLSVINAIEPVVFTFKRDVVKRQIVGFIAQELYKVLPNSVIPGGEDPSSSPWTVVMESMIPYIVGSIKELSAKVDKLEEKVAQLEAR